MTQQIDLKSSPILVRLFVAGNVQPEKVRAVEKIILRRTGREVNFQVRHVAGEEELARLRESLHSSVATPALTDMDSLRAELMSRLEQPLKAAWPAEAGALQSYELGFTPQAVLVRITYQAPKPFDASFAQVPFPRGEFCMVVAQIGLTLGAISAQTFAVIVFMVVVAAMLTPPLLKLAFRGVLASPPPETEVFRPA